MKNINLKIKFGIFFLICFLLVGSVQYVLAISAAATSLLKVRTIYDGWYILERDTTCTCSGGATYDTLSNFDFNIRVYLNQVGVTTEYSAWAMLDDALPAQYVTRFIPYGICLVYYGEACITEGNPNGTFLNVGDSIGL